MITYLTTNDVSKHLKLSPRRTRDLFMKYRVEIQEADLGTKTASGDWIMNPEILDFLKEKKKNS